MKTMKAADRSALLSAYLDGVLDAGERRSVEEMLSADADAAAEFKELQRLRALLGRRVPAEPDPAFWTRLSVRLRKAEEEERSLLPFPRTFVPAAAVLSVVGVAIVGALVIQNRLSVVNYFGQQSKAVADVYRKGLNAAGLLPVLASVDRDDALRFSLFGTLSLDKASHTTLQVDEHKDKGYRIEVGKTAAKNQADMTMTQFARQMDLTGDQSRAIDSLINHAQRRLASAVLVGENNAVAIDPELPKLNQSLMRGIAACLAPVQRVRLERMLVEHQAPNRVDMARNVPAAPEEAVRQVEAFPRAHRFVFIRPDFTDMAQVDVDLDSLRKAALANIGIVNERRAEFIRRFAVTGSGGTANPWERTAPVPVPNDPEFQRVEVNTTMTDDGGMFQVTVVPRDSNGSQGGGQVWIRFYHMPSGQAMMHDDSAGSHGMVHPPEPVAPPPVPRDH